MSERELDPLDDFLDIDLIDDGANENEVVVIVTCPKCGKAGRVLIDKRAIEMAPGKVLNYGVLPGVVCKHGFLTGIDSRLVAR